MIDPHLHVWGWEVPVYLFLGGLVAGLMVLVPLLWKEDRRASAAVRFMPFAAIGLLGLGMGALFLDLEYKLHVFRFYTTFEPTSPMSWGSWVLLLVVPVLALLGLGMAATDADARLEGPLAPLSGLARWARVNRALVSGASIALGVALGTYTGLLLGTLSARLLWSTALLGPLFMVSGLSTGAAALLLFRLKDEEHHRIVRWDLALLAVELGLIAVMLLNFATGTAPERAAAQLFLGGAYTPVLWSVVILGGLVTPLLLEASELLRNRRPVIITPVLILVGGYALRAVVVAAGQDSGFSMLS
jgi:protein NrfD